MNCSNIRPLLSAYYDNDVSTEERTQVEMHLAGCAACRRALAEFRAIGSDIRTMAVPQPPAGLRRDVWRAIEAQQASPRVFGGNSTRGVVTTLPRPREKSFVPNIVRGMSRGWAVALPAALLLGGLLLVLSVILLRGNTVSVAHMVEGDTVSDYSQPVHVQLNKQVIPSQVIENTSVLLLGAAQPITISTDIKYLDTKNQLEIQPKDKWTPGGQYEVYIDAAKVGLTGAGNLDSKPIVLNFSAAMYTPTPTSTPTSTPQPTETPVPPTDTPKPQPTAAAQNSPEPTQGQIGVPTSLPTQEVPPTRVIAQPSATAGLKTSPTPVKVNPTNTAVLVQPTSTSLMPTHTPVQEPTRTPQPTSTAVASPTVHATQPAGTATHSVMATATATVTPRRGTPTVTPTPRGGSASPTPTLVNTQCDQIPVRGFGKIWQSNQALRTHIGCASALEMAIPEVAVEHFQGGVMIWRSDLKRIYVFITGANNQSGTWVQFPDTWQDGETATHAGGIAPNGFYEPVRGFGKLWNSNGYVRQSLGWATDLETGGLTGAIQDFDNGEGLWTSDLNIYFMYNDDSFQHFIDTWVSTGGE